MKADSGSLAWTLLPNKLRLLSMSTGPVDTNREFARKENLGPHPQPTESESAFSRNLQVTCMCIVLRNTSFIGKSYLFFASHQMIAFTEKFPPVQDPIQSLALYLVMSPFVWN